MTADPATLRALADSLDPIAQVHMELHDPNDPRAVVAEIELTGPELHAIVEALRARAEEVEHGK